MAALQMGPTVKLVQKKIGYKFENALYIWEALQAPGSIVRSGQIQGAGAERHSVGFQRYPDGNRRLAVLGDTVLKLALVQVWYTGRAPRERIYRIVSDIGSNANLDKVGRTHGLDNLINKNPSDKVASVGQITMAATVEAILGAVYLDESMKSVKRVMWNLGLMPRLVRRTGPQVSVWEPADLPATSTSIVRQHEERSRIDDELATMAKETPDEIDKSICELLYPGTAQVAYRSKMRSQ